MNFQKIDFEKKDNQKLRFKNTKKRVFNLSEFKFYSIFKPDSQVNTIEIKFAGYTF